MTVLRFADLPVEPWRNGGGVTRTVAAADAWRVSIADIDGDGPFSRFEGTDRTILAVEGPPATLTVDGVAHPLPRQRPLRFPGEADVTCAIGGPTRDLNVMVRRGAVTASMTVEQWRAREVRADAGGHELVVILDGFLRAEGSLDIGALDTVHVTGPLRCALVGDATVARVSLQVVTPPVSTFGNR